MDLFLLNNTLSVLAEASCPDCEWHGLNEELDPVPCKYEGASYYACPDCNANLKSTIHQVNDYNQCDINEFAYALLAAVLEFNAEQVKGDHRYRAELEIDINGELRFAIVDMQEFHKNPSESEKWFVAGGYGTSFPSNERPGYSFDYEMARDWVNAFYRLVNKLNREQKRKQMKEAS